MRGIAAFVCLGAALIVSACSGQEPGARAPDAALRVVVTETPSPVRTGREPVDRYPPGSRLVLLDVETAGAQPIVLSEGMAAAGGAATDHTAQRILFVGKERETQPYRLFTCAPDGGERKQAVAGDTDCSAGAFLPDGRIVYSAALPSAVRPPVPAMSRAFALFVAEGDGTPGVRITFGAGCDLDPFVLADGRIAYTSWVPDDSERGGHFAIFGVHPDGTGVTALCDLAGITGEVSAPRQLADGTLVCTIVAADGSGSLHGWDWRAPGDPGGPLFDGEAGAIRGAEPGPDGGAMVVPEDGSAPRLVGGAGRTLGNGASASEGQQISQAIALVPRPRPQGHLSMVKPERTAGTLLAIDARPSRDVTAAVARLHAVEGPFVGRERPATRVLGTIPLAADGSFFASVPADTPLLLDLLGPDGKTLVAGRAPFWVRPNENRACVGCHEPLDTAPPNRRPRAVLELPVDLTADGGGGGR